MINELKMINYIFNWKYDNMKLIFFKQKSNWDCSLSCLAMIHYYYFNQKTILNILFYETKYHQGLNLLQLEKLALKYQIKLESFSTDWKTMEQLKFNAPLIIPTEINNQQHYIVILKKRWGKFLIGDPNQNNLQWWNKKQLKTIFRNIVVFSQKINNQKSMIKNKKWRKNYNWMLVNFNIIGFVGTFIIIIFNLSIQLGIKLLIETTLIQNNLTVSFQLILGILLLFFSQIIIELFWKIKLSVLRFYYRKQRNKTFFDCLKNLSWQQFNKHAATGIWRKFQFFQIIDDYQIATSLGLMKSLLMTIGSLTILLVFDLWLIIPVLVIVIIYWTLNLLLWPKQQQILRKTHRFEYQLNEKLIKNLSNWKNWKGRLLWNKKLINLENEAQQKNQLYYRNTWYEMFHQISFQMIAFGSQIVILYFLQQFISPNNQQIGNLLFMIALANNVFEEAQYFFNTWMQNNKINWLKNDVDPFFLWNKSVHQSQALSLKKPKTLHFEKVNYSYDDFNNIWKHNLNFVFNQPLLLLGKNGVGKSTLLHLIFNYDLQYSGTIMVNNQNYQMIRKQMTNTIVYLTPESKIFTKTVAENIFIYQKKSNMSNTILTWMEKLLKQNGLNWNTDLQNQLISNGQKQMIVFLSLFNSDSEIFLLDECLNSVAKNLKCELILQLLNYQQSKLILYASHDENLIQLFPQQLNLNHYV